MNLRSWLRDWADRRLSRRKRRSCRRIFGEGAVAAIQVLEDRTLLAAFVVDTVVDESDGNLSAGDLSLREAIETANAQAGADTISFSPAVFATATTITLTLGQLDITDALTITGPGRDVLTIDADRQSRIFPDPTGFYVLKKSGVLLGAKISEPSLP